MTSDQTKSKPSGYLPSLDGWRAIAVLAVMISHDEIWSIHGHSAPRYQSFGGFIGVRIFFAISGLLITSRILEEEKLVGQFDIRRFYIRRFFRIQPAAWAFLAMVALLMVTRIYPARWSAWFQALFLYINYTFHSWVPSTLVGHFWTLAVEEHFYILLSLVLLMVKRRRVLVLATLYIVDVVATRSSYPVTHGWWDPQVTPRSTQWNIYMLLMAALVALLLQRETFYRAVKRFLHPWVAFLFLAALAFAHNFFDELITHSRLHLRYVGTQVEFLSVYTMVVLVVSTMTHPASLTSRCLELAPVRFVGKISYSLYLWHVLMFFNPDAFGGSPSGHVWLMNHLTMWPMKYVSAFVAATLSYYFIEKPMIRFGHRLAPAASPGRPELVDLPVETREEFIKSGNGSERPSI